MKLSKQNKTIAFVVAGLFALTGTYNAVVINSDSSLNSDNKFLKRLDEVNGVTISGRAIAAEAHWQKLGPAKLIAKKSAPETNNTIKESAPEAAPVEIIPAAAVQEDLTLSLVEVINPKKWQQGVPAGQFNGSLSTNDGVIESLSVSLPGGDSISVAFSEMSGNVFEYDYNGEIYSGMMYQVDQGAYMVTLTTGPLEGTRLRFSSQTPAEEQFKTQEILAENNNVSVGSFGSEPTPEQLIDQEIQQEAVQANLETSQAVL